MAPTARISQRMDADCVFPVGFCSFIYNVRLHKLLAWLITPLFSNTYSHPKKGPIPGTPLALLHCNKNKIGFPGWPETQPRLGFRFRGVSSKKRGLAPAPSSLFRWLASGSRGWVQSFSG